MDLTKKIAEYEDQADKPQLNVRKFDPDSMPDNSTCVIVAPSEGGKTILAIDLMSRKKHIPAWFLFSESEGCSSRLSQTIPASYIYPEFNVKELEKIYNHQEKKIRRYSRPRSEADRRLVPDDELSLEERFSKNPCIGCYFEDCFGEKRVFNQKAVQNLFKNGRHRMMFSIIPCQYVIDLPITCRKQVKFYFLFREDSKDVRQKLFKHVAGCCRTFEIFEEIMKLTHQPYVCIVVDNICKSKRIEDRVFWYKAEEHPAFKVGCERYWRFHKLNYKMADELDDDEREARERIEMARRAKRASQLRNRRKKVPPGLSLALPSSHEPSGQRWSPDEPYNNWDNADADATPSYLNTPSMIEACHRGAQNLDDLLAHPPPNAKFRVNMLAEHP